jgi:hypothetical protein
MQSYEFQLPDGRHVYVGVEHFTDMQHAREAGERRGWIFICKQSPRIDPDRIIVNRRASR